jgi:glycosyltransferase involved in cell wall biosynthesis
VDAVDQLARLWPQIRPLLQAAQQNRNEPPPTLYILGAYCTKRLQQRWYQSLRAAGGTTEDVATFRVEGFVPGPIHERLVQHRLLVAPLRYGAGLKGKLVDAWHAGLPVVTTSIGAEGLWSDTDTVFPGGVADTDSTFIQTVVDLYTRPDAWTRARQGLAEDTDTTWRTELGAGAWLRIAGQLMESLDSLAERRTKDYTRAMLWRESCRSTEYFSKYIEYKEMNPPRRRDP